jgi:hypothetical protein
MTYTQLAVLGVLLVIGFDLWVARTRLLTRRVFWMAYAIIVFFQLLTNGVLTGLRIVRYSGAAILGSTTPADAPPPAFGDGRILFAPVEALMFGFALVVLALSLWVAWGRRGVQREPMAGPPRDVLVPILARVGGRRPHNAHGERRRHRQSWPAPARHPAEEGTWSSRLTSRTTGGASAGTPSSRASWPWSPCCSGRCWW